MLRPKTGCNLGYVHSQNLASLAVLLHCGLVFVQGEGLSTLVEQELDGSVIGGLSFCLLNDVGHCGLRLEGKAKGWMRVGEGKEGKGRKEEGKKGTRTRLGQFTDAGVTSDSEKLKPKKKVK